MIFLGRTANRGPTSTFATRDLVAKVDVGPRVVRSGIIQSDGISIVADFPPFLILFYSSFNGLPWRIGALFLLSIQLQSVLMGATRRCKSGAVIDLDPTALEKCHLQDKDIALSGL